MAKQERELSADDIAELIAAGDLDPADLDLDEYVVSLWALTIITYNIYSIFCCLMLVLCWNHRASTGGFPQMGLLSSCVFTSYADLYLDEYVDIFLDKIDDFSS